MAEMPQSTQVFAKELYCCFKYWPLASISSTLYLETMKESWPAGCPGGGGVGDPGYALGALLLSETCLKCQTLKWSFLLLS